jgi:hypothetical protein
MIGESDARLLISALFFTPPNAVVAVLSSVFAISSYAHSQHRLTVFFRRDFAALSKPLVFGLLITITSTLCRSSPLFNMGNANSQLLENIVQGSNCKLLFHLLPKLTSA